MHRPLQAILEEFVRQSNEIEGYTPLTVSARFHGMAYEESPFWVSHLQACELVLDYAADKVVPDIRAVHSVLMRGVADIDSASIDHQEVGDWRRCAVTVGGERTPAVYMLPRLTDAWLSVAKDAVARAAAAMSGPMRADMCYQLHHWFECIHPFRDGNGRTGRLLLNALRMSVGLDWQTVHARDRHDYYNHITTWRRARWESIMYNSLQRHEDDIRLYVGPGGSDGI